MRRLIGWEFSHIKEMAQSLRQALGDKTTLYAADLFHLGDYYLGCEKFSKPLWKPFQGSQKAEEVSLC